jgi:diaminopimelate decarboxylase
VAMAFPDLEYVDLGGGFPVDDQGRMQFDYQDYAQRISALFEEYSRKRNRSIKLILEPGRSLFGDTAVFCSRVIDVKERQDRIFACCDASISLLPRSMFYGEFHAVSVLAKEDAPLEDKPVEIVGNTTYSRDYLGKNLRLPRLEVGDVLVFKNAGSYCYSMMSHFLGQRWPAEVLIDHERQPRIIRSRENVDVQF